MHASRILVLIVALTAAASTLNAQQCLAPLVQRRDTGVRTFVDMQRAFIEWSRGKDLSQVKGWKWYKRWEAFNEQRANPDGSLASAETYWRGAMQAIGTKQATGRQLAGSGSGWSPVGPVQLASPTNPVWEPGMGRINCVTFHPTDPNTLWVGVAQGGIWKSVDGGEHWMPLGDDLPILRISDIAVDPNNTNVLYISVGDFAYIGTDLVHDNRKRNTHYGLGVFKTTDGGATWNPTGLAFPQTDYDGSLICRVFVHPDNSQRLLAAGTSGAWSSTDGGSTWKHGHDGLIWDIERDPINPDLFYASTGYVASLNIGSVSLLKSSDFGKNWTTLSPPIPSEGIQRIEIGISFSDPQYIYAVACSTDDTFHSFYRSTNGGTTWSVRANRDNAPNILGGNTGAESDTRGQGTYDLAIIVDPENRDRVFVGGINIWGSEDGGASWDGVSYWLATFGTSVHADHHLFAYNPLNERYYDCNDGGIYTTDKMIVGSWDAALSGSGYQWPTVWQNISGGMNITSFYRLGLSRNNAGFVVAGAQDNSSYYSNGEQWWQLFGGDGMECFIHPDDPVKVYGSSQYGYLTATDDAGRTERLLSWQILVDAGEAGEWTTPFAMHPTKPHILYAGFGNLWKSDGDDTVWQAISNFPLMNGADLPTPMSAMSISPSSPDHIYIAKRIWPAFNQPSDVWMTPDEGTTWKNITVGLPDSLYITYIGTHGSDPNTAWVTCSGFVDGVKVFKTTDAGSTWTNISRNLPNLPVNCVVHDPGSRYNAVYVGTDVGVYYTNDRMNGWEPFSENLPNVIVSELEIHQGTRKLYAATFGRGIWMSDVVNEEINSVEEAALLHGVTANILPNPVHGRFALELTGCAALHTAALEIVDITGRQVHHRAITLTGDSHVEQFDLDLPYGMYFIRVSHGVASKVVRFVVE